MLWLFIRGGGADAEDQAVRVTRETADLARQAAPSGALPHFGFYVDRVETAVRIAAKAERQKSA